MSQHCLELLFYTCSTNQEIVLTWGKSLVSVLGAEGSAYNMTQKLHEGNQMCLVYSVSVEPVNREGEKYCSAPGTF